MSGLLAKPCLALSILGLRDEHGSVETDFVGELCDHGRLADMESSHPHRLEERSDERMSLRDPEKERGHSKCEKGIEGVKRRRIHCNAQKSCLAQVVPRHPATFGRDLGRSELSMGFEKSREQN